MKRIIVLHAVPLPLWFPGPQPWSVANLMRLCTSDHRQLRIEENPAAQTIETVLLG
jgi:hypothetical protein